MKTRKSMTAAELMAKLSSDPEFLDRKKKQEQAYEAASAALREAQRPLLDELAGAGIEVTSVWELVNTNSAYEKAIPILLTHLRRPYPDKVREGIARSLAIPAASGELGTLIEEYCAADEKTQRCAKMGLAAAIAAAADDQSVDDVIGLIKDAHHGESRVLFLAMLKRSKSQSAKHVIQELRSDPQFRSEIDAWGKGTVG